MEYYLEYILIAVLVVCILYNLLPSKKEGLDNSKKVHRFVNYYASWCYFSQQLFKLEDDTPGAWTQLKDDEEVKNLATNLGVEIQIVDLECNKEGNENKCKDQGIEAYPTIKLHKQGEEGVEIIEYEGERSLESFREFLNDQLRN